MRQQWTWPTSGKMQLALLIASRLMKLLLLSYKSTQHFHKPLHMASHNQEKYRMDIVPNLDSILEPCSVSIIDKH
jgi:hypothetical protein